MQLSAGIHLGPYEVLNAIGMGGMGEVYRARDTRLQRTVAIKILPSSLSSDPESRQRFEREAQMISSLSHPNICALHDIGHQNGIDFIVMEYLEGETLAARLANGPLTVDQIVRYGTEIASALEDAHGKGIIHRDLKPANIMLTKSGVKLLDFGLAKLGRLHNEEDVLTLPTEQYHLTAKGSILGTIQYMSPEQLEAKDVDARTDIFSFGVVIYEMATGKKAFTGTSPASLISAILNSHPQPISVVRPIVPETIDRIVQTCIAKRPEDRWQTAHDIALQFRWMDKQDSSNPISIASRHRKSSTLGRILTALLALIALVLTVELFRLLPSSGTPPHEPVRKLSIIVPGNSLVYSLAVSPDGRYIVYATTDPSGPGYLWLRSLDSTDSQKLSRTEDATMPFWSPDSQSIAFFARHKLKKLTLGGGPPEDLCDVETFPKGGSWNKDGVIIFAPGNETPLYRIDAVGGKPVPFTKLNYSSGEESHRYPAFLPDGRHFFYMICDWNDSEHMGVYLGSLDSNLKKRPLSDYQRVQYVEAGYGLFVRDSKLMAQPFDTKRLEFSGETILIADDVEQEGGWGTGLFSVSRNDVLVYRDTKSWSTRPIWFDRSGKQVSSLGEPGHSFAFADLSRDENQLITQFDDKLWAIDPMKNLFSRFSVTNDKAAIFSPDGTYVAYIDEEENGSNLNRRLSNGSGNPEVLYHSRNTMGELNWSNDGRYIIFGVQNPQTKFDEWILPLFGDRKPSPFLQTQAQESSAQFSPDGKWIAYVSDESGEDEVYVQSFPQQSSKLQITNTGGEQPRWRSDGKELFYLTLDKKLMAVEVENGTKLEIGTSQFLFHTEAEPSYAFSSDLRQYFPSADGNRFLINTVTKSPEPIDLTVVLNWTSLLKK